MVIIHCFNEHRLTEAHLENDHLNTERESTSRIRQWATSVVTAQGTRFNVSGVASVTCQSINQSVVDIVMYTNSRICQLIGAGVIND